MRNIIQKVEGNILTLTIDLSKQGTPSSSGKTLLIASSEGNAPIEGRPEFKLGLNLYTKEANPK